MCWFGVKCNRNRREICKCFGEIVWCLAILCWALGMLKKFQNVPNRIRAEIVEKSV